MITFYIGRPGEGKTLSAVRLVLAHFKNRDPRPVVTNIMLVPGKIAEFLPGDFADNLAWVNSHLFTLQEDEVKDFYRFRGTSEKIPVRIVTTQGKPYEAPDFSAVVSGVFYVLDEVHIHFSARNWQATGASALFYLSQHRKLLDDVVCITQHPKLVDTQFRMLAQEWVDVVNRYRRSFAGFLTMPRGFLQRHYPTIPEKGTMWSERHVFSLRQEEATCYDSMSGVGVTNSVRAPELVKKKGIPIVWLAFGIAATIIGALVAMKFGSQWYFRESLKEAQRDVRPSVPVVTTAPVSPAGDIAPIKKDVASGAWRAPDGLLYVGDKPVAGNYRGTFAPRLGVNEFYEYTPEAERQLTFQQQAAQRSESALVSPVGDINSQQTAQLK